MARWRWWLSDLRYRRECRRLLRQLPPEETKGLYIAPLSVPEYIVDGPSAREMADELQRLREEER